jgi:flagellar export protein FliJ
VKRFEFPLDRVLAWRRTQARLEEAKLEPLLAREQALQAAARRLEQEGQQAQQEALARPSSSGDELAALDNFRQHTLREQQRTTQAQAQLRVTIDAHRSAIAIKRRDVRLLEKLREQRWSAWQSAAAREVDQQAEDSHLARWKPLSERH